MSGKELLVRESSQVRQLAQADNDNQVLAMWLHGHASVATTGRYLHARPGDSSARYLGV